MGGDYGFLGLPQVHLIKGHANKRCLINSAGFLEVRLSRGTQETVPCCHVCVQTVGKLSCESGQGRDMEGCFSNAHRQQETLLGPGSLNNLGAQLKEPTGQGPGMPGFEPWLLSCLLGRSLNPFEPGAPQGQTRYPFSPPSAFSWSHQSQSA